MDARKQSIRARLKVSTYRNCLVHIALVPCAKG